MKIRMQDNSVRFRITVREAEMLFHNGWIESRTEVISRDRQHRGTFVYGIHQVDGLAESRCEIYPGSIKMLWSQQDCEVLIDPTQEGVYLRQKVELEDGTVHRFIARVEKDRPAARSQKPDEWMDDRRNEQTVAKS